MRGWGRCFGGMGRGRSCELGKWRVEEGDGIEGLLERNMGLWSHEICEDAPVVNSWIWSCLYLKTNPYLYK